VEGGEHFPRGGRREGVDEFVGGVRVEADDPRLVARIDVGFGGQETGHRSGVFAPRVSVLLHESPPIVPATQQRAERAESRDGTGDVRPWNRWINPFDNVEERSTAESRVQPTRFVVDVGARNRRIRDVSRLSPVAGGCGSIGRASSM
jgi:hypothetical protein